MVPTRKEAYEKAWKPMKKPKLKAQIKDEMPNDVFKRIHKNGLTLELSEHDLLKHKLHTQHTTID